MKSTITICLFVFTTGCAIAQKQNFVPGYIVKNYFDTTRGFVNDQHWKFTPEKISFKSDAGSVTDYSSADITSFLVAGKLYESVLVDVETSPDKETELTTDPEFRLEKRKVFLGALIPGEKGLYYYQPENGKRNFYIKFNGKHQVLLYKSYVTPSAGSEKSDPTIAHNNKFQEQLAVFLEECPSVTANLNEVAYTRKSLEKLVGQFFICTERPLPTEKLPTDKITPKFTALAGTSVSFLKFRSKTFPYLSEADFKPSLNFTAGLGLEIFPSKDGKWSFVNELVYLYYNIEGDYVNDVSATRYESAHSEFFNQYVKLNTLFRLNVQKRKNLIFFNAGISNGYALSLKGTQKEYRRLADFEQYNDLEPYDKEQRYEIGVLAGAGLSHNRMTYQIRYESSNGFTVAPQLTSKVASIRFLVSYHLNYEKD